MFALFVAAAGEESADGEEWLMLEENTRLAKAVKAILNYQKVGI